MKKLWWIFAVAVTLLAVGCGKVSGETSAVRTENAPVAAQAEKEPAEQTGKEPTAQADTGTDGRKTESANPIVLLIAAAASLENCLEDQLIPMFEKAYPQIKVEGTYDSSGKLQTQIEEGVGADIFLSAAMKQMDALSKAGLMEEDTILPLLENKIVLIVSKDSETDVKTFEDILKMDAIAVGDPESVPAGQYAKEAFESLGIWEQVEEKASFGTNVVEVLNWVGEGSAQAGVVYSTDAASNDKVVMAAQAPEGSVSRILYPAGMVKASEHPEEAKLFLEFLTGEKAMEVFESYGFSAVN